MKFHGSCHNCISSFCGDLKNKTLMIVDGSSGNMGLYYFLMSHQILRHKLNLFLTLKKYQVKSPGAFH